MNITDAKINEDPAQYFKTKMAIWLLSGKQQLNKI
jgi:hypothetical protein